MFNSQTNNSQANNSQTNNSTLFTSVTTPTPSRSDSNPDQVQPQGFNLNNNAFQQQQSQALNNNVQQAQFSSARQVNNQPQLLTSNAQQAQFSNAQLAQFQNQQVNNNQPQGLFNQQSAASCFGSTNSGSLFGNTTNANYSTSSFGGNTNSQTQQPLSNHLSINQQSGSLVNVNATQPAPKELSQADFELEWAKELSVQQKKELPPAKKKIQYKQSQEEADQQKIQEKQSDEDDQHEETQNKKQKEALKNYKYFLASTRGYNFHVVLDKNQLRTYLLDDQGNSFQNIFIQKDLDQNALFLFQTLQNFYQYLRQNRHKDDKIFINDLGEIEVVYSIKLESKQISKLMRLRTKSTEFPCKEHMELLAKKLKQLKQNEVYDVPLPKQKEAANVHQIFGRRLKLSVITNNNLKIVNESLVIKRSSQPSVGSFGFGGAIWNENLLNANSIYSLIERCYFQVEIIEPGFLFIGALIKGQRVRYISPSSNGSLFGTGIFNSYPSSTSLFGNNYEYFESSISLNSEGDIVVSGNFNQGQTIIMKNPLRRPLKTNDLVTIALNNTTFQFILNDVSIYKKTIPNVHLTSLTWTPLICLHDDNSTVRIY